jgi:ABC-2 type transport system ATP-binding protein
MFMPEKTAGDAECAIAVRGLTKRFGRRVAIEDLTLSVRPGEICGLAGANGGGKSTSLRMLAGLIAPDRGEGSVLGCDLVRAAHRIRHKVGYLAQRSVLYPTLSVRENLRFRAAVFGSSDPARSADLQIAAFGLTEFAAVLVGQLSGGWCRQVDLAAALIHHPRVLLLDEPTAGLDPAARQAIWRRLVSLAVHGATVVLSTHDLNEAQHCERVLLLSDGRIRASGSPREVVAQVSAVALIVSGQDALNLPDLLQSELVLAARPLGKDIRLVVRANARREVETLIAAQGCWSKPTGLSLEDAALVVAQRIRGAA